MLFSTKFAFGEWNMAPPCEIAPLWNICFANVKWRISFHIEQSEIFHNFRKEIISHSATPNISLKSVWVRILIANLEKYLFRSLLPKKFDKFRLVEFFYPSRRLGISSRRSRGYHQGRQAALVSHHAPACILLRLDDIQNFVLMIYRNKLRMISTPSAWLGRVNW